MAFDFHQRSIQNLKQPFQLEKSTSGKSVHTDPPPFRYDPKHNPIVPTRHNFDTRQNRFFNPVSTEEVEDLRIGIENISLHDLDDILDDLDTIDRRPKVVNKNTFMEHAKRGLEIRKKFETRFPTTPFMKAFIDAPRVRK